MTTPILYEAFLGRLENDEFWAPADDAGSWVQVDFGAVKRVNGIRTQGSVWWERWVETLQVQYGNSTDALTPILEDGSPKVCAKALLNYIFSDVISLLVNYHTYLSASKITGPIGFNNALPDPIGTVISIFLVHTQQLPNALGKF